MAAGAAIAVIGATAFQMAASRKRAQAQAKAAEMKAYFKRAQAEELLRRSEFNIEQLRRDAKEFQSAQQSAFAKSGVALGVGVSLEALQDTTDRLFEEINIQRREAQFKAGQLFAGADIDTQLSGDILSAGRAEQAGIFLQGAGRVASISQTRSGS